MPSTPEAPSTRARTPPTPLHGALHDNYQPYSPRRSTRSTAQSNPYSSLNGERSPCAHLQRHTTPPPTARKARFARAPTQLSSPPSSPASPVRARPSLQRSHKTPRKTPLSSARKATGGAGSLSDSDHHASSSLAPPAVDPASMLPTPSKTPKKRNAAALSSTARILSFQPNDPNDVMPSPRKIKKHGRFHSTNGFDLYDEQMEEQADNNIPIYTDPNARVPELDGADDNPFVGPRNRAASRPQRRGRKAKTEDEQAMEEAARRDEGVVYVFRGKKVFRRFSDPEQERSSSVGTDTSDIPGQRTLRRQAGVAAQRPLTRSSIKPRLLFPSEEQLRAREHGADDEEALTDIEVPMATTPERQNRRTRDVETPTAKHHHITPATPPSTSRAARSKKAEGDERLPIDEDEHDPTSNGADKDETLPAASKGAKKSLFDSWQRTKAGRKRAGEATDGGGSSKRTRSTAAES